MQVHFQGSLFLIYAKTPLSICKQIERGVKRLSYPAGCDAQPAGVIEHFIAGRGKAYRLIPREAFNYSSAKYLMVRTIWLV